MSKLVPKSVLIVGSGVFGLSTAWALAKREEFKDTSIIVVDDTRGGPFPPLDVASVDSSRIIRADYSDSAYAALADVAQEEWRKQADHELGGQGRYSQAGLMLTADKPESALPKGKLSGLDYAKNSWRNVDAIARHNGYPEGKIRTLESPEAIRDLMGSDICHGDWGYINELSGWADAGRGMQWLYEQVTATGRVEFIDAIVEELVTEGKRIVGAKTKTGAVLRGDLVFVAAGAWTGGLIDLRGRVEATGQAVAYIDITDAEFAKLKTQPVVLNLSSGLFIIPPQDKTLKVARHGFGWLNPVTAPRALPTSPSEPRKPIKVSLPLTSRNGFPDYLPAEADVDLRRGLRDLAPVRGLDNRPWKDTRICWYADTRDGDWLVDYHPGWDGLFVATGDSGHGYKFLPVLGDKIADCILGRGGELGRKWSWKDIQDDGTGRERDGKYYGLRTEDGSRSGTFGLNIKDELAAKSKL